jgi:hypothetical protein
MHQKTKKTLQQLGFGISHQAKTRRAIQGSNGWQQPAAALTAEDFRLSEVKEMAG